MPGCLGAHAGSKLQQLGSTHILVADHNHHHSLVEATDSVTAPPGAASRTVAIVRWPRRHLRSCTLGAAAARDPLARSGPAGRGWSYARATRLGRTRLSCSRRGLGRRHVLSSNAEESQIAYGVVHQFEGGTQAQYEASIAAVHTARWPPRGTGLPHRRAISASGWTIVAIHDSKESWEKFRNGTLMPGMQAGIAGGFTAPPKRRPSRFTPRRAPDGAPLPAPRPAARRIAQRVLPMRGDH